MKTELDEVRLARVLDTAQTICIHRGSVAADDVAAVTKFPRALIRDALTLLVGRGDLLARPGGRFARALVRHVRLPGQSWPTELRLPVSALMVAR